MKKLEIYKNGNFLNAYEENAIILHKLFNYKVIESDKHKYKCGFPLTQYNKIINGLQDNKISYIVYDNETILEEKNYHKLNNYEKEYKDAMKKIELDTKANIVYNKVIKLNDRKLEEFLDKMLTWLK